MSLRHPLYARRCVTLRLLSPGARPCHELRRPRIEPLDAPKCFMQVRFVYPLVQLEIFQLQSQSRQGYDQNMSDDAEPAGGPTRMGRAELLGVFAFWTMLAVLTAANRLADQRELGVNIVSRTVPIA